jgi:nicotinamidase-related amidase
VERFKNASVPGLPIIRRLEPEPQSDFYILKPCHSGFFRTGLEVLLDRLETHTLILTGFAADICVLFTAYDAYMRGFSVVVPPDCVASEREHDEERALAHMKRVLKAELVPSTALNVPLLVQESDRRRKASPRTGRIAEQ